MDISETLRPTGDELAADDLLAGPMTIAITDVRPSNNDVKPVAIYYQTEGQCRPYLPSKGMRKAIFFAWGPDTNTYKNRGLTLFREPSVRYQGIEVGGIRISHASGLEKPLEFPLTLNKSKKIIYKVEPLRPWPPAKQPPAPTELQQQVLDRCIKAGLTEAGLTAFALRVSEGAEADLLKLPQARLEAILRAGVSPQTVNDCNKAS